MHGHCARGLRPANSANSDELIGMFAEIAEFLRRNFGRGVLLAAALQRMYF
jgi:hypothetical protein